MKDKANSASANHSFEARLHEVARQLEADEKVEAVNITVEELSDDRLYAMYLAEFPFHAEIVKEFKNQIRFSWHSKTESVGINLPGLSSFFNSAGEFYNNIVQDESLIEFDSQSLGNPQDIIAYLADYSIIYMSERLNILANFYSAEIQLLSVYDLEIERLNITLEEFLDSLIENKGRWTP